MFEDNQMLSPDDLERLADNTLTHFTGNTKTMQEDQLLYNMTGDGDDDIHFSGENKGSFVDEPAAALGKIFSLTLANTTAAAQDIIIFGGYKLLQQILFSGNGAFPDGYVKDGNFKSLSGVAGLTGTPNDPDHAIAEFITYLLQNPTRCLGLQIQVSDVNQFAQRMSVTRIEPYNQNKKDYLNLDSYRDQYAQNDKLLKVSTTFQLDNQTELAWKLIPGVTTTITFYLGNEYNIAKSLEKKANRAGAAIKIVGQKNASRLSEQQKAYRQLGN